MSGAAGLSREEAARRDRQGGARSPGSRDAHAAGLGHAYEHAGRTCGEDSQRQRTPGKSGQGLGDDG